MKDPYPFLRISNLIALGRFVKVLNRLILSSIGNFLTFSIYFF